jgi:hypothetical protein
MSSAKLDHLMLLHLRIDPDCAICASKQRSLYLQHWSSFSRNTPVGFTKFIIIRSSLESQRLAGGRGRVRGERRRVRSDWSAVERERGISVSSVVMSFEHEGLAFNLLDTPGHQDVSEDTYWFWLSTDQPCGCHNRMVLSRISASTIGRPVRLGGSSRYLIST